MLERVRVFFSGETGNKELFDQKTAEIERVEELIQSVKDGMDVGGSMPKDAEHMAELEGKLSVLKDE